MFKVCRQILAALAIIATLGNPAPAQDDVQMQVQAQASATAYETGQAFYVALKGDIPSPWHAYYRNPGTVGDAMTAELATPAGFSVEGPFWQTPKLHTSDIGVAYVYEQPVVVWRVTPRADAPASAQFTLRATAQLCSDSGCMPPHTAEATLELAQGAPAANPAWQNEEKGVETLGDAELHDVRAESTPKGISLHFRYEGAASTAYFFSDDNAIAPAEPQSLNHQGDKFELSLPINDGSDMMYPAPEDGAKAPTQLTGTLTLGDGAHARISVPISAPAAANGSSSASASATESDLGLWTILTGLFLGGLLLNAMPCVFPVLGLKIMSFVSLSGGSRSKIMWHAFAFVAGILVSFWLLGLAIVVVSNAEMFAHTPWQDWLNILLDDTGTADRNWADWMQNKWAIYGIMLLLLVLGLGMFGIFEIGAGATGVGSELQQKSGFTGSFFQGFLITIVATPCSAPFLGVALPAAMSLPALWMLLALTAMASGLALPYLILGLFPTLASNLPRPGAWMESLKQALSFLLFAAAAWMLDVYLSFVDSSATMWLLISLVIFCSAFWVYGRWCPLYRSKPCRLAGFVVALLLAGIGIYGSLPRSQHSDWVDWSPQAMNEALQKGSPVYVDFTAKWCTTCQANKKLAYSDEVYKLFRDNKVVLMRADKTLPNAAIDAELRRLHRSAVPTNALYLPGKAPVITNVILTSYYLKDFLQSHLAPQN